MKINNFDTISSKMSVNGLSCVLNMPDAIEGEGVHSLPPHNPVLAYPVDDYNCPENWMHGSAKASSYFLGVKPDSGMWLDFNECRNHAHHVAILISIQGINPITGLKSDKLRLEKYKTKCPLHDIEFGQDRYCKTCDFKWPAQNFISSVGTPYGYLWLDGFRKPDWTVRQYIFTEEEIRSVAKTIIGEDRVFAIGIAFYLSKELKPVPKIEQQYTSGKLGGVAPMGFNEIYYTSHVITASNDVFGDAGAAYAIGNITRNMSVCKGYSSLPPKQHLNKITTSIKPFYTEGETKEVATKLEIGAGANIDQQIYDCPEELSFWQDEPAGMLYVNYSSQAECMRIISQGKKQYKEEGFLDGIKVGKEIENV